MTAGRGSSSRILPSWEGNESLLPAGTVPFQVDQQDLSLLAQAMNIACLSFSPQEREANKEVYGQLYAFYVSLQDVKDSMTGRLRDSDDNGFLLNPFEVFSPPLSAMLFLTYWHVTVLLAAFPGAEPALRKFPSAVRRAGELVNRLNDIALVAAVAAADMAGEGSPS